MRVKVVDIYDGDTFTAIAPLVDDVSTRLFAKFRFRLYGIDTPEMKGESLERARAARNRVAQLVLRSRDPVTHHGKLASLFNDGITSHYAWVECLSEHHDKYGRVIARMYTDPEYSVCINDILLEEGYASAFMCDAIHTLKKQSISDT